MTLTYSSFQLPSSPSAVGGLLRRTLRKVAVAAGMLTVACAAQAADFPDRSLQIILSFPPGGATDVLARELSQRLTNGIGQSVVVLNRPGAGGMIGMQSAAQARPDGYTLYISSIMSNSIYEAFNGKQSVALDSDFDAVGTIASAPHILVTPTTVGLKSLDELVAYLKKDPGKYNYASMGAGTLSNLEGEIFKEQTGVDALQIPYKGSSQAIPEVISGTSAFMFDSVTSSLTHIQNRNVTVLGVASDKRLEVLPDVPTMTELGVPGLEVANLFALMAPRGTPPERIEVLAKALEAVKKDPEFAQAIAAHGFQISELEGSALHQFILDQQAFWIKRMKELGISAKAS